MPWLRPAFTASCAAAGNMARSSIPIADTILASPLRRPESTSFASTPISRANSNSFRGAWIASAKFAALAGEQDPLLGNREPFPTSPIADEPQPTDGFTRPGAPPHCRHATGLPQFVTRARRRLFLPAGPSRAEVDRQRLIRCRTARRRSARYGPRHSSSDEISPVHRTFACAPGSGCRADDAPADNARD